MIKDWSKQREEVKANLLPYAQKLYECISEGHSDYVKYDSERGHIHSETTKANLINNYIMHRVKRMPVEDSTIRMLSHKKMDLLIISDTIAIRFKRLDEQFKSKNVKTKNVKNFRSHKLDIEGSSLFPLDAGYRLNTFRTDIEEIYFVCPEGDSNRWRLSAADLSVSKYQPEIFARCEEDIIPIVSVKPHLKKDDRKAAVNQ